jgi:hypothetical protein
MYDVLDDLDPAGTLARVESVVRRRRGDEVEDLLLVAHWADLHAADPRLAPDGSRHPFPPGGNRLVQLGGEGTPLVQDLCLVELAIARGVHPLSVRATMADALDLRHRLPRTWRIVLALKAEVWVARKVASLCRKLSPAAAAIVDAAVADAIAGESPARVLEIAAAKVIEADTAAHEAALEVERRRRYVGLGRTDEFGLRQVIARVTAGDAVWVDATVDRVADILATRPDLRPETPTEIERDELRSVAFGWLARPAELLTLLLEAADASSETDPDPGPEPEPSRAIAVPTATLERLRTLDLAKLRPSVRLHVHLHEAALVGFCGGVARVEELGPMLLTQVRELLGHCNVRVSPVIDLKDRVSVNAYEFPEAIKDRIHLMYPGEVLPHATRKSRKVDVDHPKPFERNGPPGQTGTHNAGPLGRTGHRAKTHLGYTVTQTARGDHVWRTPHGLHRIVDERGTHVLDQAAAVALTSDDPLDRVLAQLMLQVRTGALGPPTTRDEPPPTGR